MGRSTKIISKRVLRRSDKTSSTKKRLRHYCNRPWLKWKRQLPKLMLSIQPLQQVKFLCNIHSSNHWARRCHFCRVKMTRRRRNPKYLQTKTLPTKRKSKLGNRVKRSAKPRKRGMVLLRNKMNLQPRSDDANNWRQTKGTTFTATRHTWKDPPLPSYSKKTCRLKFGQDLALQTWQKRSFLKSVISGETASSWQCASRPRMILE
mmetsp:Transcript_32914/g.59605  ORF Transcript_32914/g.59605 Transcript_32914/m.59605 type:complete len:205 (-) Transcript_32914:640-1254(-)